jgi:hypothetical protein
VVVKRTMSLVMRGALALRFFPQENDISLAHRP